MSNRKRKMLPLPASAAFIFLVLIGPAYSAGSTAKYKVPHTEYGQPDLQGVWNYNSDVPMERPAGFESKEFFTRDELKQQNAEREKQLDRLTNAGVGVHNTFWLDYYAQVENLRTSLITYPPNGKLPKLMDGVQKVGGFSAIFKDIKGTTPVRFAIGGIGKEGPEQRGFFERCVAAGSPPIVPGVDNSYLQIFQTQDTVVILTEHIHDARIIPLNNKPLLGDRFRSWMGESRGHFEGDTLVIVTRNFNDLTQSFEGAGTAYNKVVTERLTRTGLNVVEYHATIDDPKTFQDRIEVQFPMARFDGRIFEFACHEGNYSMDLILGGARKEERDAKSATE